MTTTRTARHGREWRRLETPGVALTVVALVAFDGIAAAVIGLVKGDTSCLGLTCRTESGISLTRPWIGLLLALGVIVLPILLAWWRHTGLRTTVVVQLVVGAGLVVWTATSIVSAAGIQDNPPPVPFQPSLRPCAEETLRGHTCLTYSNTPPPPSVGAS